MSDRDCLCWEALRAGKSRPSASKPELEGSQVQEAILGLSQSPGECPATLARIAGFLSVQGMTLVKRSQGGWGPSGWQPQQSPWCLSSDESVPRDRADALCSRVSSTGAQRVCFWFQFLSQQLVLQPKSRGSWEEVVRW